MLSTPQIILHTAISLTLIEIVLLLGLSISGGLLHMEVVTAICDIDNWCYE